MKHVRLNLIFLGMGGVLFLAPPTYSGLRDTNTEGTGSAPTKSDFHMKSESAAPASEDENDKTKEEAISQEDVTAATEQPAKPASKPKRRIDRADAFVAGADWEFDGFVSGGQDQIVKSMFYQGDLTYLNIGSQQGLASGDKIGIYKRGERIRDPQTSKFIGYEVRRAAIASVTDQIQDETCAVRIVKTYEPVEIGDLVRREE